MTTCSHCQTKMNLVRSERTERSVLEQYRCPVCNSVHLSSGLCAESPLSQQRSELAPMFPNIGLARA
jgi:hypothetical protein